MTKGWENLKVDKINKCFINNENKCIKVLGHFTLGSNIFVLFNDSNKIYLVSKENENTIKRINVEGFFNIKKEDDIK